MARVTHGEFASWANEHADALGLVNPETRRMVQAWEPILVSNGYTLPELRYATKMLAANPPKYIGEHIKNINLIIGNLRRKAADEEQRSWAAIEEFEACKNCQNFGWVFVPHWQYIVNGEWVVYPGACNKRLCVVTCSCNAGRRIASTHTGKRQPMSLERYDERNPDWRRQLSEYKAAQRAERKLAAYIPGVDKSVGKVVGDIAAKLAAGAKEELAEAEQAAKRSRNTGQQQLRLYDGEGKTTAQ